MSPKVTAAVNLISPAAAGWLVWAPRGGRRRRRRPNLQLEVHAAKLIASPEYFDHCVTLYKHPARSSLYYSLGTRQDVPPVREGWLRVRFFFSYTPEGPFVPPHGIVPLDAPFMRRGRPAAGPVWLSRGTLYVGLMLICGCSLLIERTMNSVSWSTRAVGL